MNYLPQRTIKYSTFIKTAVVEALRDVFENHVDEDLKKTNINIEFPREQTDYPTVIVKFYEKNISATGVGGGEEYIDLSAIGFPGIYKFKRSFYWADIEFEVMDLSSLSRDLIGDSIVQTIQMGNLESYTNAFFNRIYPTKGEMEDSYPDSFWHYININTDTITGGGEQQTQTPWQSEDDLIYKKSYRVPVFGEFHSLPPDAPAGLIEAVIQYPYIGGIEEVPTGDPEDEGEWSPLLTFDDPE